MWAAKTVTPPISSDSCGMLPVCASHIYHALFYHWNAMCAAAWKSRRQWNRSVCIRIGCISFFQVHGHDITIYSPRGAINCCHLGSQLELSPFDERGLFWKTFDFGFYLTEGIWDISLFGKFVLMVCICILLLFTLRGCVTIQTVLEQQLQLSRKPGFGWLSKTAGRTPEPILKSLS